MESADLMELFNGDTVVSRPVSDLALRASFDIPDIERLLRENKELRAERDTIKAAMVEIKEMIEQWRAVHPAAS